VHVPAQFTDWFRLWAADDIQRDRLMSVAAEAIDFRVETPAWRVSTLIPRDTSWTVGFLARFRSALCRMPDGTAVDALARLGAHPARMRQRGLARQAATDWIWNGSEPLPIVDVDKLATQSPISPTLKLSCRSLTPDCRDSVLYLPAQSRAWWSSEIWILR
jgi:hypothetical protein